MLNLARMNADPLKVSRHETSNVPAATTTMFGRALTLALRAQRNTKPLPAQQDGIIRAKVAEIFVRINNPRGCRHELR